MDRISNDIDGLDKGHQADAVNACTHCGSALSPATVIAEDDARFCCQGCLAAYRLVRGAGLDRYYVHRAIDPSQAPLKPDTQNENPDPTPYVQVAADGTCSLDLAIDGLQCAACVWLIESLLGREPGVGRARINVTSRRLSLNWTGKPEFSQTLAGLVTRLGYHVSPWGRGGNSVQGQAEERDLLRCLAVAGFAAANVMLLSVSVWAGHDGEMTATTRELLHWVSALIALPSLAYAGRPFFRSALAALSMRRTNMDVPISIGVILAAGVSLHEAYTGGQHAYFDSAITLVFFLLVGRYLERRARGRASSAAGHLLAMRSATVTVIGEDGTARAMVADDVPGNAIVLVARGERIGVDGIVIEGRSEIDTSLVTGESIPERVATGSQVFSGMVNLASPLKVRVGATGERTLIAEIVRLLEVAEQGRARFVALADRVSRAYAPVVHSLALLTFAGWMLTGHGAHASLLTAVTVLIITCPCALALAVPVVQIVAAGSLMRRGILLKTATALERMAEADTIIFDKTGTLTEGRPVYWPEGSDADPACLSLASGLAAASRHPLAKALRSACPDAPLATGVREVPGEGLSTETPEGEIRLGNADFCGASQLDLQATGPEVWLKVPGLAPRRFAFIDRPREDARETVSALRALGYEIRLLSGDRESAVAAAAAAVGITDWASGIKPSGKCEVLQAFQAKGRRVLMVGDGINDAPALAAAHVSLSPASAADVTMAAADAVFQGAKLGPVTDILLTSRKTGILVKQNLVFALCYNAFAVPLAILGFVTPLVAALAMSSSSIVVIVNALRLDWHRKKDAQN